MTIHQLPNSIQPLDVFAAIKDRPFPFFLDSSFDLKGLGRYSFLGSDPYKIVRSWGTHVEIETRTENDGKKVEVNGDPFDAIRSELSRSRPDSSPLPFVAGGVGYLSYDLLHFLEDIPDRTSDDIGIPDCHIAFYDTVLAFDHHEGKAYISSDNDENAFRVIGRLTEPGVKDRASEVLTKNLGFETRNFKSNLTKEEYMEAVLRAKDYIASGDIYQVNLSQRFEAEVNVRPYELYLRLREASPAPFSAYLDCGNFAVLSSSPERFLKKAGGQVETRPIKGTRPRGTDENKDDLLKRELRESVKDKAEHIMIVDLERNDLGRVCRFGSVKVTEDMAVESFAQVHHMVSTVCGELREGVESVDLVKATFPGGSITGAPKVRAMEIIDELESVKRGIYTGSIGYIGYDGSMDLNIAIRTIILKDGKAFLSVGGGIVADSDPESEYQETIDKAKGMMEALNGQQDR